ncbi:MAG: TorF family putative porin [Planctomycetota bacterium]
MKRQGVLLVAVILLSVVGLVQAQEDAMGVTLDATWVSKYLWRGFDQLDDKAALQPSVDVDLFGSGFSVNVWASYPTSAGSSREVTAPDGSRINATEYNYTLAYDAVICEGEPHATEIRTQYIYYDFIDNPDEAADAYELGIRAAWPNICPTGDVTPSYYFGGIWPAAGSAGTTGAGVPKNDLPGSYSGWIHIIGVEYDLRIAGLTPETPEQIFTFSAAAVYNDGFADTTGNLDHDWSHAVFGVSTDVELAENFNFTPGFYYQSSWEDTVNPEDEYWVSVGLSYAF